jgi:hypothetical protein
VALTIWRAGWLRGHDLGLMPARYVRPFVKTDPHERAGAEAGEAVQRPQMRFVPIKSAAQLDLQVLHRARDRLVTSRTGLIDQVRAFLLVHAARSLKSPRPATTAGALGCAAWSRGRTQPPRPWRPPPSSPAGRGRC